MTLSSAATIAKYGRGETIFTQGDACSDVLCIRTGGVKLSVQSKTGYEAMVATLGPGDFFGEECLAGLENRTGSTTAITPSEIAIIGKDKMARLLHSQHSMSDRFISHMLSRQISMEEDLVGQFFNSSEQRLASALLQLAGYGRRDKPARTVPMISCDTLANWNPLSFIRSRTMPSTFFTRPGSMNVSRRICALAAFNASSILVVSTFFDPV